MQASLRQIAHLRMLKSGIISPFNSAEECVKRLFGIQSQAQQFGEISLFNRVEDLRRGDLNALYQNHRLIKIWGQRMTVHMFSADDWKIVHQVYADRNNFIKKLWQNNSHRLTAIFSEIDKLTHSGQVDKKCISALIDELASEIETPYRDYAVIIQACLNGLIFGIPNLPQTQYYAHRRACVDDDLYQSWNSDRHLAIDALLIRYFQNYAPATIVDFCHWSGLKKAEIQAAFARVEPQLTQILVDKKPFYLFAEDAARLCDDGPVCSVKLLGKFDPLFVSFADKSWIATPPQQKAVWRPAAHIESVLLVAEKLTGTWRYKIRGKNIDFTFYLFGKVSLKNKRLISSEAEKIAGFLSKTVGQLSYE